MTFSEYYHQEFRTDLERVLQTAPAPNHLGHSYEEDVVLQPRIINRENKTVRLWSRERRELFGVALFFTVLADQVCYTHFPQNYAKFRSLTRYPKFKGNCPGGCSAHVHPRGILSTIGRSDDWITDEIPAGLVSLLAEALPVMEREVLDFTRNHMPELDGHAFWFKCLQEIPGYDATSDLRTS